MATPYTPEVQGTGIKANIQRMGGYLAGMVMPNIGAFIAFGLITALFIPDGWLPNKDFAELVTPMIQILLPILIGYTGGRLVHGQRGAVVGAIATMGVIVGADIPMLLGAMIIGPLAAYVMKHVDALFKDRIRPGFEMLVDNFSAGIVGGGMALLGNWIIGPVVDWCTNRLGDGVEWLVDHNLLPFAAVLIEPAKVLFLNNAINHGVLTPLGAQDVTEKGKSILFMLESNPGPGLGLLLAFLFFGPKLLRPSVPAAIVIQFLGGIHEIYFPYVLMKPRMILAPIAGSAAAILVFLATDAGLVGPPSPGSIFAYGAQTPRGGWFGVFAGVFVATAVSFAVGSLLLGFGRFAGDEEVETDEDTNAAVAAGQLPEEDAVAAPVASGTAPVEQPEKNRPATSEV